MAPDGSPFRPLYDDKIMFSGQPIALVLAEEWEIARFAASLVRVDYDEAAHVTDIYRQRDKAVAIRAPTNPLEEAFAPQKPRGKAEQAFAAADVRHQGEYYVPIEHHNPMELYASTVVWEGGGKLTVYDKTQGVQNVQRTLCGIFDMKPDDVRVMSPFMGGGFGSGLRPQYQVVLAVLAARALKRPVRLVLTRQQMYGLGYRPAMIQRIELGANAGGTLDATMQDAVTVTSQYEQFHRQETGWSGLLYKCANAKYAHKLVPLDLATLVRHARAERRDRPLCSRIRDGRARSRAQARSAGAAPALLLGSRPAHQPAVQQQGAARMLPPGRGSVRLEQAQPRAAFDARRQRLVGWGMASGIWEALQMPITVRIALTANGHAEVSVRDLRHRHRHLHDHGAGRGRHARPAARQRHASSLAIRRCRNRRSKAVHGLRPRCRTEL